MKLIALLLSVTACYPMSWYRVEPPHFGRHQQVRIWSGDSVVLWHAVVMTHDSISGIPYHQSLQCDSCRRSLPRAVVDSVKAGTPPNKLDAVLGWILIPIGVVGLLYP